MAPLETPSRFPPARQKTSSTRSRPIAPPQFAPKPQFIVPWQSSSDTGKDDIEDINDHDLPTSTPSVSCTTLRRGSRAGSASYARDEIEDSEDERPRIRGKSVRSRSTSVSDTSTPVEPVVTEIDEEFEILFGSPKDRSKRRRISVDGETPKAERVKLTDDSIPTLSPNPMSPDSDQLSSPVAFRRRLSASGSSTKKHFRSPPRFTLSGTTPFSKLHGSVSEFAASTPSGVPTQTPNAFGRRKPAFILPPLPSPGETGENTDSNPTPFSPSSRTLHRRGRPRSSAPAYLPGGMAAEARSWILEMGSKREQHLQSTPVSRAFYGSSNQYAATAKVEFARQGTLSSSGPVAFVQAQPVHSNSTRDQENIHNPLEDKFRNILLLGPPRLKPTPERSSSKTRAPELRADTFIGVHRGLVWEVELDRSTDVGCVAGNTSQKPRNEASDQHKERWLVGVEWDVLPL